MVTLPELVQQYSDNFANTCKEPKLYIARRKMMI